MEPGRIRLPKLGAYAGYPRIPVKQYIYAIKDLIYRIMDVDNLDVKNLTKAERWKVIIYVLNTFDIQLSQLPIFADDDLYTDYVYLFKYKGRLHTSEVLNVPYGLGIDLDETFRSDRTAYRVLLSRFDQVTYDLNLDKPNSDILSADQRADAIDHVIYNVISEQ